MAKVVKISEKDLVDIIKKILSNETPDLDKIIPTSVKSFVSSFSNGNVPSANAPSPKNSDIRLPSSSTSDDEFYRKVLECLGAKPTKGNMAFMYAWRQAEGADADYNPFNTTINVADSTIYNSAKVKNYKSQEDGIKATCDTLKLSNYSDILNGLRNDVGLYKLSRMESLKKWGTGELLAKVADGYLKGATPKPKPIDKGSS
jgi:hypothetical protein